MLALKKISTNRKLSLSNHFMKFKNYSNILVDAVESKIKEHSKVVADFRKKFGNEVVGEITVNHLYGGMGGMLGLVCETSSLDSITGITFRDQTIKDVIEKMPRFNEDACQPLPEGMFWLLLTSTIPTKEEVQFVSDEWKAKGKLPDYAWKILKSLPKDLHPMSQFGIGIQCLQKESKFAPKFETVDKSQRWKFVLEDAMNILGKLPALAAHVYNHTFKGGKGNYEIDCNLDWSGNYNRMMGFNNADFDELMRLYLTLHCDHEGGNVSAHTAHVVGSALADPYLALTAGLNGLAGPLHGLANQKTLEWLDELIKTTGENPKDEDIRQFLENNKNKVIPGYGHAVLRATDPRFIFQQKFAQAYIPDDPMVKLVAQLHEIVPSFLKSLRKVRNPYPNVDAHSGVLLRHYGLTQSSYYTVLFGVSRAIGILAQLVWARGLLFPIERPKSITTEALQELVSNKMRKK